MKIGQERPSLSERLGALKTQDDQTKASQAAAKQAGALMDSMLTSFKSACELSSSSVLSTIEADLASLVLANRKIVSASIATMQADLNLIRRLTRFGPPVIVTCLTLFIATSFAMSWCWAHAMVRGAQTSALQDVGITTYSTPTGTILLLDGSKLSLAKCRLHGEAVACLRRGLVAS